MIAALESGDMGDQISHFCILFQPFRESSETNNTHLATYCQGVPVGPQLGIAQAVTSVLHQSPCAYVPLIGDIIGNAQHVVILSELSVYQRLAGEQRALIGVIGIHQADLIAREDEEIVAAGRVSYVLESKMIVEEGASQMLHLPFLAVHSQVVLPECAENHFSSPKETTSQ